MEETMSEIQNEFLVKKVLFVNHCKGGTFTFKPNYKISFLNLNEKTWETSIIVTIEDAPSNPFPFNLQVEVCLVSRLPEILPETFDLKDFLRRGSINVLFPYVRSVITNLTTASLLNPIFLPVIDANKIAQNIEIPNIK